MYPIVMKHYVNKDVMKIFIDMKWSNWLTQLISSGLDFPAVAVPMSIARPALFSDIAFNVHDESLKTKQRKSKNSEKRTYFPETWIWDLVGVELVNIMAYIAYTDAYEMSFLYNFSKLSHKFRILQSSTNVVVLIF
ncbi:hypothetical protein Anas_08942 [Armadillidium nasatum]|uniref:Uncharacterized protein n=1 Tax=Armadillidium nasatum TaxID=96803 RepID=A0A5N5TPL1_9CRUS|nr:hypothetical protein Anas_08942 [Armadillidium nasatum]